jgi:hypothetical protein
MDPQINGIIHLTAAPVEHAYSRPARNPAELNDNLMSFEYHVDEDDKSHHPTVQPNPADVDVLVMQR